MANNRTGRINEEVLKAMGELLRTVKDPRVSDAFLSVVHCDVTKDLSYCTVYISALGQVDAKELMKGLKSASGYLRRELAHTLALRHTPELIFKLDDSIAHGARISKLIDEAIK
jgi:ribosome-binding factor A